MDPEPNNSTPDNPLALLSTPTPSVGIPDTPPITAPVPVEPDAPAQATATETDQEDSERRSHSKIGRLPKVTRDKLNLMVRDGIPYQEIPARLGGDAKNITARNISSWQSSPHYQRWLLEQDWLEDLRDDQESAFDLLNDFDCSRFNEGALQLAVTRLFLALRHIDAGDLNQKLGGNAQSFARLVNALARACHETTNVQKYREACARAVAAELKQMNIDRDLSDNEYQLVANRMDKVFKVRHPSPAPPPTNGSH